MIKIISFYFVHRKRTYPKLYHLVVGDEKLINQISLGTVWKYKAWTRLGPRWQTIVITEVKLVDWTPRFSILQTTDIRCHRLNTREQKAWEHFCTEHCLNYLIGGMSNGPQHHRGQQ